MTISTRVWHPYTQWECWQAGMWRRIYGAERKAWLERAVTFTGNAALYGSWMRKVVVRWPVTCEHHLTDTGSNRRAFVGHAAVCLAIQCPEDITREAWGMLTEQQRVDANAQADGAIDAWERAYAGEARGVRCDVDGAGLSRGYPGRSGPGAGVHEQGALFSGHLSRHHEK